METYNLSVTPPLSDTEFIEIPLPTQQGLLGDEPIPAQHLRFDNHSVLSFPLWPFMADTNSRPRYAVFLRQHIEDKRHATVSISEVSEPSSINNAGIVKASRDYPGGEFMESQVRTSMYGPSQEPVATNANPPRARYGEPVKTLSQSSPSEEEIDQSVAEPEATSLGDEAIAEPVYVPEVLPPEEQSLRMFVSDTAVALVVSRPIYDHQLTSWLCPEWDMSPANIQLGNDGSEFHIYKRNGLNLEDEQNPLREFASRFIEAVAGEHSGLRLNPTIHKVDSLDDLLLSFEQVR